ncbi:hypothetical protein [Streptomyces sp. NPDC059411]|uniref:hypothetical protein n=1 Tax=Streptomyces sp. NPDC059411 TaxID=3346825 RepID=UPI00369F0936
METRQSGTASGSRYTAPGPNTAPGLAGYFKAAVPLQCEPWSLTPREEWRRLTSVMSKLAQKESPDFVREMVDEYFSDLGLRAMQYSLVQDFTFHAPKIAWTISQKHRQKDAPAPVTRAARAASWENA